MSGQHPADMPLDTSEPHFNFASPMSPDTNHHHRRQRSTATAEMAQNPPPGSSNVGGTTATGNANGGTNANTTAAPNGTGNAPTTGRTSNVEAGPPGNHRPMTPAAQEEQNLLAVKSLNPYTTFQQLAFLPPVPSSILASSYVIPPRYESVVDSTPAPPPKDVAVAPETPITPTTPGLDGRSSLLSPISLLSNPTAQAHGPPGLFFVTKAKQITGIVDAEGRSIIRKPVFWQGEPVDPARFEMRSSDVISRVEMLVSDSQKTILIGVGPNDIQAVPVLGSSIDFPFGSAVSILPPLLTKRGFKHTDNFDGLRDVVFLGKANATNQVFWAERKNNTTCLYAVATTHY
ncbi:hypothetical protein BT69DRAFT_1067354 [Atractiella rhizophila]|nr:hypothetical protein BT69DRAFT_1067354 [Atractiella rhizophila]